MPAAADDLLLPAFAAVLAAVLSLATSLAAALPGPRPLPASMSASAAGSDTRAASDARLLREAASARWPFAAIPCCSGGLAVLGCCVPEAPLAAAASESGCGRATSGAEPFVAAGCLS